MTESKHTPGPWVATPKSGGEWNIDTDAEGGWAIALVMGGAGLEDPNGRTNTNARLIAAAPELLAALREIETICTESAGDCRKRMGTRQGNALVAARAALAKVEVSP